MEQNEGNQTGISHFSISQLLLTLDSLSDKKTCRVTVYFDHTERDMSTVHSTTFDRDSLAQWYARQHLKTDPGITAVYYLPTGADERDIRLVEVNTMIGERQDEALAPIDFGVDRGEDTQHSLVILDVTPLQWQKIQAGSIHLPAGWFLVDVRKLSDRDLPQESGDDDE